MVQLEGSIPLHLFKLEKPVEGIAKPFGEETKKKKFFLNLEKDIPKFILST